MYLFLVFLLFSIVNPQQLSCPQIYGIQIPNGTDKDIVQYIIDGNNCLIKNAEAYNINVTTNNLMQNIHRIFDNAEANCNGNGVTAQVIEIGNIAITSVRLLATQTFKQQQRLIAAGKKKIKESEDSDSRECDVSESLGRALRVAKRVLYGPQGALVVLASSLPRLVQVAQEAASDVVAQLVNCSPGSQSASIATIRLSYAAEAQRIAYEMRDNIFRYQEKVLEALNDTIKIIYENF